MIITIPEPIIPKIQSSLEKDNRFESFIRHPPKPSISNGMEI